MPMHRAPACACRDKPSTIDMLNTLWLLDSLVAGKLLPRGGCSPDVHPCLAIASRLPYAFLRAPALLAS